MKITKTKLKNIILEMINTSHPGTEGRHADFLYPDGTFRYGVFNLGNKIKELNPTPEAIEIHRKYEELKKRENFRPWTEEEGHSIKVDDGYGTVVPLRTAWGYPHYSPMMIQAQLIAMKMKVRQRTFKDQNLQTHRLPDPMET